jgi:hypothetical protein
MTGFGFAFALVLNALFLLAGTIGLVLFCRINDNGGLLMSGSLIAYAVIDLVRLIRSYRKLPNK